jgi:hypothetical protein
MRETKANLKGCSAKEEEGKKADFRLLPCSS